MMAIAFSWVSACATAPFELVDEYEPEGGVILVDGIGGSAPLAIARDIDDAVLIERQTQCRLDDSAHVWGHVAGIKTGSRSAHD
jgi:hypothetical protein